MRHSVFSSTTYKNNSAWQVAYTAVHSTCYQKLSLCILLNILHIGNHSKYQSWALVESIKARDMYKSLRWSVSEKSDEVRSDIHVNEVRHKFDRYEQKLITEVCMQVGYLFSCLTMLCESFSLFILKSSAR
jgi:hypothetical protein